MGVANFVHDFDSCFRTNEHDAHIPVLEVVRLLDNDGIALI